MAQVTRQLARAALRGTARPGVVAFPRQTFGQSGRRFASSQSSPGPRGNWPIWAGAVAAGSLGVFIYTGSRDWPATQAAFKATEKDYQAVYNEIAGRLEEKGDYDDGSYGPVLLRLAWHASGTFDKETGTGGSNGATMRFMPEASHGANAGLKVAREFLEPVKGKGSS